MASSARTELSDADLYEKFRDHGLSHTAAVLHVERRRSSKPQAVAPPEPGKGLAALVGGAQGATSGFADELIGAMQAIRDPNIPLSGIDSSIAATRQQFDAARSAHPLAAAGGNVAGSVINPVNRLLGPLTKGLSPAATGGVFGGVLGGAQGFGEGEGSVKDRLTLAAGGAGMGAMLGLAGGYVVGKVGKPLGQMWRNLRGAFAKTDRTVARSLGKSATPETLAQAQEAAHRAYLQKNGFSPEVIDRLMETWRAGGLPPKPPPPAPPTMPPSSRPGEVLKPIAPRGFAVEGPAPPTKPGPTGSFWEQLYGPKVGRMPDIGQGKTLPYYSRGGRVEQSFGPPPMSSPSVPGSVNADAQMQAITQYLRSLTPEQLPDAIAGAQALGINLGGTPEQVLALLLGGR